MFTELVGTAIANAEAQAALGASRARIVVAVTRPGGASSETCTMGAEQRLVTLALQLREAQATAPPEACEAVKRLDGVVTAWRPRCMSCARSPATPTRRRLPRAGCARRSRRCPAAARSRVHLCVEVADPAARRGGGRCRSTLASEALTNTARHAGRDRRRGRRVGREEGVRPGSASATTGAAARTSARALGLARAQDWVEALGGGLSVHACQAKAPL